MSKKKILSESQIRRFMGLAGINNLADGYISRGEGVDVELLIALDVRQILRDGDDHREDSHEACDEQDGRRPREGQPERRRGGVMHPEVEQKSAHRGDDHKRRQRRALEAERRHAVDGAEEQTEAVQLRDERSEIRGDDARAGDGEGDARRPRQRHGEFAGGDGEKGLVHLVDVDVVDLVDADDVAVAAEEGNKAEDGARDEREVEELGVGEEAPSDDGGGAEDGASDGVRSDELPHRAEQAVGLASVVHGGSVLFRLRLPRGVVRCAAGGGGGRRRDERRAAIAGARASLAAEFPSRRGADRRSGARHRRRARVDTPDRRRGVRPSPTRGDLSGRRDGRGGDADGRHRGGHRRADYDSLTCPGGLPDGTFASPTPRGRFGCAREASRGALGDARALEGMDARGVRGRARSS